MERAWHGGGVLVRHAESAIAADEEDGAAHARFLRDADPRGLGHDGAHAKVDFAVEYLVTEIGIIFVVESESVHRPRGDPSLPPLLCCCGARDDPSVVERNKGSTSFILKALYEKAQILFCVARSKRIRNVSVQQKVHLSSFSR